MVAAMTPQKIVMVVEDEPAIRGLLSMTLECENYHVETAGDGREALDKVEQVQPDAILLDLMLPTMDGWALIDALSERSETDGIPIIAVSATQRYLNVGERGVHAFLSKPFDVDTLLIVLEEMLH
jgi:CheY-like chemotaxis protein